MSSPDIRIRRLNLEVVQRGAPWFGRQDLHRTAERVRLMVMADLDGLLERALDGCADDERLASMAIELTLDGRAMDRAVPLAGSPMRAQVAAALERVVATALADPRRASAPAQAPAPEDALAVLQAPQSTTTHADSRVLTLLLAWHAQDCLAQRLQLLAPMTVERWLQAVTAALDELPVPSAARDAPGETGSSAASAGRAAAAGPAAAVTVTGTAATLFSLVALAAQWAPFRPPELAVGLVRGERSPPSKRHSGEAAGVADSGATATPPMDRPASPVHDIPEAPRAAIPADAHAMPPSLSEPTLLVPKRLPHRCALQTALPFLMLGPLSRVGWLETAAALNGPDRAEHIHVLGYALALKALPIPARGWRHAPEHLVAAAFAAGLAEAPDGSAMSRMQHAFRDDLSALDAIIADALVRGHDRRAPLALVARSDGVALVEPEGLFPMALGACWSDVAPVARAAGAPLLLDPLLPATVCAQIDAAGLAFVATGTPTRGEGWRPIAGRDGWRGMTNAGAPLQPGLVRAAPGLAGVPEDARRMLDALGPSRPLAPGLEAGPLDATVTLAVAMAMGEICWRLAARDAAAWAQPEPGLALQRFADLPATMIVTRDEIEIRLPLGPRSRDLGAAGMLADVRDVPWLGGALRFGTG